VRELAAGRQETLTLPLDAFAGMIIAGDRRLRRPRLELVVTDRANNVVRRSGRVAFRIVERPLLDYRVTLNHDFEMYSKAGNRAVARLVNRLITGLARGTIKSRRELRRQYVHGSAAIRRQYDAIDGDDAVEAIYEALYVPLKRKGYDPDSILDY